MSALFPKYTAVGPRRRAQPVVLWPAIVVGLVNACSPASVPPVPESPTHPPEKFVGNVTAGDYEPLEWWKTFDDPALDRIVEAVLVSNFDLVEAVARVDQARTRARIASAFNRPRVQPSAGIDDIDAPSNTLPDNVSSELSGQLDISVPDRVAMTTYSMGAEFAYEFDLWGRSRNEARAAGAESLASEWDFRAARIGVVAQTVHTYLEIAYLRRQRKLSGESVEVFREREKLTAARYDRGLDTARDLYAARQKLWNAQTELSALEGRLADAEGRLWVLLGGYRADLANMLPDSPSPSVALDPVPAGIPVGLLVQRPDVGAARQRMEAARYAVGARRADLLPSLTLSGTIGLRSTDLDRWFNPAQWFRNLSANLLGPAFQGSRLRDNVTLAETRLRESVAAYGRSIVTAVNEVEAVLARLEASRRRHTLLRSFAEEAKAETAFQERRYRSGVADYDDFLAASQSHISARIELAAAERDLGYTRLALHRALGGVWTAAGPAAVQSGRSDPAAGARVASASAG
ncbi:MAG: efflux transporter outer membrane subunit [Alphaproteobacteria bacterium]|nr:efflux transporter outer membrane subunit [Alphaproteobacteria bacterium]